MDKLDFKKTMKPFWQPPVGSFVVVEVPRLPFIMVDGRGDPNTATEYRTAVQWLFSTSYALKFASKAAGRAYGVAPLEGLCGPMTCQASPRVTRATGSGRS